MVDMLLSYASQPDEGPMGFLWYPFDWMDSIQTYESEFGMRQPTFQAFLDSLEAFQSLFLLQGFF